MMPVYRYMDSHPMRREQVSPMQQYPPTLGTIPPYMHVDPSKSAAAYGLWPHVNSFGYSVPCHACCGHGNFIGYYSPRPPCSHSPPPQYQCYGYPPYHEAVPVQYVPPPRYSMENPSCGYDKAVSSNNHCCGCSGHTHNQKSDEKVKVEELDPGFQKKEGDDSMVPFQMKNCPYPIVWIPPDNIKNKEPRKPMESEMPSREKDSWGTEPPKFVKPSEQEARLWNGWFPLDMKNLGPLMQAEYQKRTQNHQNEDKMQQFPFPVFWLPQYHKQDDIAKEDGTQAIASQKHVDEPPSAVKFFPLKLPGSGNGSNQLQEVQDNSRDQVSSDTEANQKGTPVKQMEMHGAKDGVSQKSIPVQQMEAFRVKENSEGVDESGRSASLTNAEDSMASNASGTCVKRQSSLQSSSPSKTSKLPPVCLRVDPLPKKKNGSSGSRSPSPPGSKGQPRETSKDTSRPSALSDLKVNTYHDAQVQDGVLSRSKEVEANNKEGKVIEVFERNPVKNKDGEAGNGSQTEASITFTDPQKEVFRSPKADESKTHEDKYVNKEGQEVEYAGDLAAGKATKSKELTDEGSSANDDNEVKGRKLSDEEAALLIQSAYRGFEVRRWEPLKKLKQIAQVQKQVVEVKDKIHALESSSDLQKDDRQMLVIGEMIMSLLLKLDAIQGLHPKLRDIRKSLARELVALQEKLDSLIMKMCEETAEPKKYEDSITVSSDITVNQDTPVMEVGEHPSHCLPQMEAVSDSEDKEITKPPIPVKEEYRKSVNEVREVEIDGGAHVKVCENKVDRGEFQSSEVVMNDKRQGIFVPSVIEQADLSQSQESDKEEIRGTLPEDMRYHPQNEQPFEVTKLTNVEDSPEVNGIEALQHEITGKVAATSDEEEGGGAAIVAVIDGVEMESNASRSASTAVVADSAKAEKTSEVNFQEEFPLGLTDDEAPQKLKNSSIQGNEIPSGGDSKTDTEPSSLNEEIMIPIESERHCMEVLNKGAFPAESEDSVKVGLEKGDGHEDAVVGVCVEQPQALEVNDYEEQVEVVEILGQEKMLGSSQEQEESSDEKQKDGNGHTDRGCSSELTNKLICSQEKKVLQAEEEKDNDYQLVEDHGNEEMKLEKKQYPKLRVVRDNDNVEDQLDRSETTKNLPMVGQQFSPVSVHHDEEEREVSPASPTSIDSKVFTDKQGMRMESVRKLSEENEKLREMMERLIETGNCQLNVISNLTERVKDLEKKLSKKKKLRARRCRAATSPSSARPLLKSPRKGAGVAM